MPYATQQRTGVVILRVWVEVDADGLRARITESTDIETREHVVRVTSSIDGVVEIVRAFLEQFVRDASVTSR